MTETKRLYHAISLLLFWHDITWKILLLFATYATPYKEAPRIKSYIVQNMYCGTNERQHIYINQYTFDFPLKQTVNTVT